MSATEATWTTEGVTEGVNMTEMEYNSSYSITCGDNYIPTVAEYSKAMGAYQTALLSVGGCTTGLLYLLFATQVYHTLYHVDKRFRRDVLWLTSVCPFMTLMSVISVIVPRADTACNAFKVTYLSLGMSHFMDMTTAMFGNEKVMLARLKEDRFNLKVGPVCYCCLCLPSPPVNRDKLRWVRWLLWQMPYSQAAFFMMQIVLSTAMSDSLGRLNPNFSTVWLTTISFVTIVSGIYGLQITAALCRDHLLHYGYQRKSLALKILVLASQLQSFTLDVLGLFNVYPCLSPILSPRVFKQTLENMLYLPEMLVIGLFTWKVYRTLELQNFQDPEEQAPADPAVPRSSFASIDKGCNTNDKGSNAIPVQCFNEVSPFPSYPRSSMSSSDKGSDARHSKIQDSHNPISSSSPTLYAVPLSNLTPPSHHSYSSSSSPPSRPPRSLRSSSAFVPSSSPSCDSKDSRVHGDSCIATDSPTLSLPPYSPSMSSSFFSNDKRREEQDVEKGRREGENETTGGGVG